MGDGSATRNHYPPSPFLGMWGCRSRPENGLEPGEPTRTSARRLADNAVTRSQCGGAYACRANAGQHSGRAWERAAMKSDGDQTSGSGAMRENSSADGVSGPALAVGEPPAGTALQADGRPIGRDPAFFRRTLTDLD